MPQSVFVNTAPPATSVSSALAQHVAHVQYEDLPPAVTEAAKTLMLDTLAAGWAGAGQTGVSEVGRTLAEVAPPDHQNRQPSCRIWGGSSNAPMLDAVFVNSAAAAALDFDPLHLEAVMHSQIMTVPALLAIAQQYGCSGRDFLTALALADDINCRLAMSAQGHNGWFFTSIFGIFGTAAACAKLMGGDRAVIQHALGIALFQVAGTQQSMLEKSLTKRFMAAFAARGGAFSALLAMAGVTAPAMPFEGRFGLSSLYQACNFDKTLHRLGDKFENGAVHIKKYPCCGCSHALIEATLQLTAKYAIAISDVAGITIQISEFMNRMIGGEFSPDRQDPSVLAQFNAKYAVACALLRNRFELQDLEPSLVMDPAIARIAERITITIDPLNDGELVPAVVTLELVSGKILTQRIDTFPGMTGAGCNVAELKKKVSSCLRAGPVPLDSAQIDRVFERVSSIESNVNMTNFFSGF